MSSIELLLAERAALCDTFTEVGPDAPTLCEGWLTLDLAAHLVVRERRPDTGPGLVLGGPFARHTEKVRVAAKQRGYDALVAALRERPPWLHRSGPMAGVNLGEFWIHHEDVRRARGDGPRPADPPVDDGLWHYLGTGARLAGRRIHGAGLTLVTPDGRERVVRAAEPMVTVTGAPGELVLFMAGRKEHAEVTHAGEPEAVAIVLAARFGV
jgi:uncharacterized protein (TIGR03085 family)